VAQQVVYVPGGYVVRYYPSPPPPPLSDAVPSWFALYFFLGFLALYLVVMAAVVVFSKPTTSGAEGVPLSGGLGGKQPGPRARSWMDLQRSGQEPPSLESIDKEIKKGFVRKVYSLLTTQLLLTVGINVGLIYAAFYCGDPHYPTDFAYYFVRESWITFVTLIGLLIVLCALFSYKNTYPANYILLFLFTAALAFTLSRTIIIYYSEGAGTTILLALAVTAGVFVGLTIFTMITPLDWNFLGPFLFAGIWLLLFWCIFAPLLYAYGGVSSGWALAFAIIGTILFSGFIIYDTNNIMRYMGVDDYVIACVELYLDVINLFMCILSIFQISSR